jgi:hypothetical protein
MATRPANGWNITNHAVDRYRERAVLCCERSPSDLQLRKAMLGQLEFFASLYAKGGIRHVRCGPDWRISKKAQKNVCERPTHTFVVIDGDVVTTLGFMMTMSAATEKFYARQVKEARHQRYLRAAEAVFGRQIENVP